MNRFLFAAALATTGFTAVAVAAPLSAQTAPGPIDPSDHVQTRDEAMAQADARFDRMDTNKDGRIDATEMAAMRPAGPPPGMAASADGAAPPPRAGGRMFTRLDTNGDGVIDRAEFRAQAMRRFDRIDTNHDGKIDAAERQAARDAMGLRGGRGPGGDMPPPPPPADAPKPDAGQ